jgi:hypothetical protein
VGYSFSFGTLLIEHAFVVGLLRWSNGSSCPDAAAISPVSRDELLIQMRHLGVLKSQEEEEKRYLRKAEMASLVST